MALFKCKIVDENGATLIEGGVKDWPEVVPNNTDDRSFELVMNEGNATDIKSIIWQLHVAENGNIPLDLEQYISDSCLPVSWEKTPACPPVQNVKPRARQSKQGKKKSERNSQQSAAAKSIAESLEGVQLKEAPLCSTENDDIGTGFELKRNVVDAALWVAKAERLAHGSGQELCYSSSDSEDEDDDSPSDHHSYSCESEKDEDAHPAEPAATDGSTTTIPTSFGNNFAAQPSSNFFPLTGTVFGSNSAFGSLKPTNKGDGDSKEPVVEAKEASIDLSVVGGHLQDNKDKPKVNILVARKKTRTQDSSNGSSTKKKKARSSSRKGNSYIKPFSERMLHGTSKKTAAPDIDDWDTDEGMTPWAQGDAARKKHIDEEDEYSPTSDNDDDDHVDVVGSNKKRKTGRSRATFQEPFPHSTKLSEELLPSNTGLTFFHNTRVDKPSLSERYQLQRKSKFRLAGARPEPGKPRQACDANVRGRLASIQCNMETAQQMSLNLERSDSFDEDNTDPEYLRDRDLDRAHPWTIIFTGVLTNQKPNEDGNNKGGNLFRDTPQMIIQAGSAPAQHQIEKFMSSDNLQVVTHNCYDSFLASFGAGPKKGKKEGKPKEARPRFRMPAQGGESQNVAPAKQAAKIKASKKSEDIAEKPAPKTTPKRVFIRNISEEKEECDD